MNVLLAVPWDQEFGGVASVVGHLARDLEKRGHRVTFLHPGESERPERRMTKWGFVGYEARLRSPFNSAHPIRSVVAFLVRIVPTLYWLGTLLRSHRIEIVNIHYPLEGFVYFGLLRWIFPIRVIVSVHGADLFPDGRPRKVYPSSLRFLLRSADAIVAPSEAFVRDCASVLPRVAGRMLAIHNGIDIEELQRRGEEETKHEINRYLLCIAAHNEKKALDMLLKAFVVIRKADPELRLLLVGDGPLRVAHETLARALAVDDRVQFLGWRGRAEVGRLLRNCRLFVLPSRSEPFGIVVTEALACRRPVVATAVGGIPEIIEDGQSGLLVKPDDPSALAQAVLRVLQDDVLRDAIAQAGHARVREYFGSEKMAARYEHLYSDVLDALPFGEPAPARDTSRR